MAQIRETLPINSNSSHNSGMYNPLTEMYNKPLFIQVMESLLRISIRQHMPVSLAITSIDHYSELCEKYNENETDNLIKDSANLIKSISRDSDVLAHFEGDLFALLLYNCNHHSSKNAAERLRVHIEKNLHMAHEHITVSIGLATFGESSAEGKGQTMKDISEGLILGSLHSLEKEKENRINSPI